jgi:hypothetical protein
LLTEPVSDVIKWRSRAPAEVIWFDVPPDFIAFHRPSGKTHFLNAASKVLLTELLTLPSDFGEILEVFPSDEDGNEAHRHDIGMRNLLAHLEALGLIERS